MGKSKVKSLPLSEAKGQKLPTTNYQLPTTNYQLPTTNYQLPITNYQLPKKYDGSTRVS
jgi:hypothetical protein